MFAVNNLPTEFEVYLCPLFEDSKEDAKYRKLDDLDLG